MQRNTTTVHVREHAHTDTWVTTMDWPELLNHLVQAHGESREELDNLEGRLDGTVGRRRRADDRHRTLHPEMPE